MELGSEFALGPVGGSCVDNIFHYLNGFHAVYMDSGRSALKGLLRELPLRGFVLLPAYICESVYQCFPQERVRFYGLTADLQIDWNDLFQQLGGDVLIVYLHYFNGVLPDMSMLEKLHGIREKQGFLIIEDTTHSIFSAPLTIGDYGVCSLRKWFPVPDGGVVYGKKLNELPAEGESPWTEKKAKAMELKRLYLSGQGGEERNAEYRRLFAECDRSLDNQQVCYRISSLSRKILESCSISGMVAARRENSAQLKTLLKEEAPWLRLLAQTSEDECPLTFPVETENRDALRSYLISQKVYCAVHWPLGGTPMEMTGAASVSNRELSFPIDQRYGEAEMQYLADCLRSYGRGTYAEID